MMSFVFVNFALNPNPTSAVTLTTICIDPTPVTASVSDTFTVEVKIKNVTDLYQWQLKLTFDPNLLECLNVTQGPFLPPPTIWIPPIINNTAGTILAACSRMVPPGQSGSCVLAYIKFHCDGPGECDLVIDYPDTFLLDSGYYSIPRTAVNGHAVQKALTRYLHREEPLQPVHLNKEEPIVPVHMNSNITLTPVHMHFIGPPGQDPILYPKYTYWHELYPQFCEQWFLTSWIDNGDEVLSPNDQIDMMDMLERVTYYHVDRITWTLLLSNPEAPSEQMYVEYKGSFVPGQDPITQPVCTYWHEVYPTYCNVYHIIWASGPLQYCTYVELQQRDTGIITFWHVEDVAIDLILREKIMDPRCTWWHEIYPNYCEWSHLTSWEDTGSPYGQLSPSDQIDMDPAPTDEWYWDTFWSMGDVNRDGYINDVDANLIAVAFCSHPGDPNWDPRCDLDKDGHVGVDDVSTCAKNYGKDIWTYFPDLGKREWYHVDRVTLTLNVTLERDPTEWMKIELKTSYFEEMYNALKHPLDTLWHEVYPYYSNIYQLVGWDWWEDDNCNGVLDVCDYIWLYNVTSELVERYHVEDICYDIILTKKCFYEPIGTQWHELYPEYCRRFNLTSWIDTNQDYKLSPSDQIDMTDKETGKVTWYHVDRVTLTIKITEKGVEPPVTLYAEFTGPLEMFFQPIMNPVCTYWHVVWPPENFSSIFHIGSWIDNGDGVLSYCDYIDVEYKHEPGVTRYYHIEEVACDIILTKKCFYEPIGSIWHELYPEYCRLYELTSWKDTNKDSKLSPSDFIDLTDIKAGEVTWYHIDRVTLTIKITEKYVDPPVTLYAEFTGPFDQFFEPIMNPVCTIWHVIYPPENFSTYFHLTSWEDNGDGVLSYCDQIDVEFEHEPGKTRWYHVEELACDIVISCTGIVVAGSEDTNVYGFDFFGNLLWTTPTVGPVLSVAMDNNGSYVAAGSRVLGTNTGALYFMDAFTGTILWSKDLLISESYDNGWMGTESKSVDVKYNKYNQSDIVAAAHDGGLNLYDQWGNLIWQYNDGYHETIVRISQDGNYIVCANYELGFLRGGVHYFSHLSDGVPGWDPRDGTPVWSLATLPNMNYFWVAISGIGEYVAASGFRPDLGHFVSLHNRTGALIWRYTTPQGLKGGYIRVDMPCDGKSVVAVNDDPSDSKGCDLLYFSDGGDDWDPGDGTPVWNFWPGKPSPQVVTDDFYSVAISGNGDVIATGGIPQNVYLLWRDGTLLQTIADGTVQSLDLTFTGEYGVAGDRQSRVWFFRKGVGMLWNYATGGIVHSVAVSKIYPCMFPYPDHDVDVHYVKPLKNVVGQKYATQFNVTLSNEGAFNETAYIKIWAQNSTHTLLVHSSIVTLTSGTMTNMTLAGSTTKLSKGNYLIFVTISIVQNEIDVYDNTYVDGWVLITIPGDINGDQSVNILDAIIMASHFGHKNGDDHTPCTKAWRDCMNSNINCDGTVNILDAIILAGHFGEKWP